MWRKLGIAIMVISLGVFGAAGAYAQPLTPVPPAGFDMIGFIQKATRGQAVGAGTAAPLRLRGGKLTINGIEMIVPNNSIVQMPAATFSWADLFGPLNSTPVTEPGTSYVPARPVVPNGRTGLALFDGAQNHFPSYEVRVVGNVLTDPATGAQTYVVGMILPAAQQGLNSGSGLINFIDYDGTTPGMGGIPGRFRVGGTPGNSATGVLCELNDPVGRFGAIHSPDPRFSADTGNPTMTTATGYPVGIPFPDQNDPLRPATQRPLNNPQTLDPFLALNAPLRVFVVPAPGAGVTPDSRLQMPLMVGDWVDFSGTLLKIDPTAPNVPANMFVSVHSLTANLDIKTTSGSNPAYIRVEAFVFGVGPFPTPITDPVPEASSRVQMVAFTTDSSATASVFAINVDHATGDEAQVPFPNGANVPMNDPLRGRIRLQLNRNQPEPPGNAITSPSTGNVTYCREYIVKLDGAGRQVPNVANGLTAGQYRLPIFDYIFPEGAVFGRPLPPYNFNQFDFLTVGGGRLDGTTGPFIGPLDPFPG